MCKSAMQTECKKVKNDFVQTNMKNGTWTYHHAQGQIIKPLKHQLDTLE